LIMANEADDDILEGELADDALEKTMKKAESEASRALQLSTELLKKFSKEPPKEETTPQDAETTQASETKQDE